MSSDIKFIFSAISSSKVFSLLNKLSISKATGLDNISAKLPNEEIITNQQSGFRSLHSTVTALLEATDSWALDVDRGNVNAVVFLDLKKAFDTVDHDVLLSKLSLYGVQESAYDWFKSYLHSRTQKCVVNGSLYKVCSLGCGVPQ